MPDDYAASTSTTGRVTVGSSATGQIETAGDTDWFAVTLTAGQSYQFGLTSTSLDAYLRLYSGSGSLITWNDDDPHGGTLNSLLSYTPTSTGTYYLGASDLSTRTGNYTISAETVVTDDYAASSSTTGRVTVGSPSTGQIETSGDIDWFAVTLTAGQHYQLLLASSTLSNPALRIYSGTGNLLASNDNSYGNSSSAIDYSISSTGTYYLAARNASTGTGSYTISANLVADDYAASSSTTGSVTVGSSSTGQIETGGDHDWFAVTLTSGQAYQFRLTSTSLDAYLRLYSGSGSLLSWDDDSGGSGNSLINYTASSSGTYYLDAADYSAATGSYTLSATAADDYAASSSTTGRVTVGSSSTGQIETAGDSDWFAVTLTAGQSYRFGLTSTSLDSYLRLYSGSGSLITSNDDDPNGGTLNSLISYSATSSGTYYLGASDLSTRTGSYTVSATPVIVDDYAASTATTGRVTVGSSSTGQIEVTGDHDWFAISLTSGNSYQFSLTANGLTDPYLRLYSSSGTLLASNDNSNSKVNSLISYTATSSGTYYLDASDASSGTGNYSIAAVYADDYAASTSTTGRVTVGSSSTGQIQYGGDTDWFAVTLTAGVSYEFGQTSTSLDSYLRLYSGSGSLISSNDDGGGGLNSLISYTATGSGTYYLSASDIANATGSYTVSATVVTPDDYSATTSTTGRVTVGSSTTGRLETPGDSDWFAVTLTAGQTYQFRVDATAFDASLTFRASDGSKITADSNSGGGTNPLLTYTPGSGGTYYLDVYGGLTGAGTYTVSAAAVTVDDYAANASTTGRVTVGSSSTGRIESSGDVDWFAVTLTAGQNYQFGLASTSLDSYLRLYSGSGSLITSNDDDAHGGTLNSLISYTATGSGTYYLGASDLSTRTGSYTVSATVADDYAASSSTTGRVTVGSSSTGQIETSGDHDWFAVTLTAGQGYQFRLASSSLDAYLRLYSGSGTMITSDDDSGGNADSLISYTATGSGTYYLDAADLSSGTGSYTVSAASVTTDDYVANSSTTGRVTVGSSTTGNIESSGDHDWFAVTLTSGQSYQFRLTSTSLDSYLRLYSSSGKSVASDDDSGGNLNSLISYTATSSGTYYLDASDYSTGTGSYTVAAATVTVDDYAASTSTTGRVTVGSSATGQIETNGDSDWFAVSLTAGQSYQFSLTSTGLTNPNLRLYSGSGTKITSNDDNGGSLNSLISYTATGSGTYYLGASDSSTGTGSYTVAAAAVTTDDYAASILTSGRVTVGSSTTGRIETSGDHDWFAVTLTAGQNYQFQLTSTSLDSYLRLYSGGGTLITYNDDSGGSLNSLISYTATSSGTYYLDASDYSSGTGSYTVSATAVTTDDYAASAATTGRVTVGSSATGRVESSGDHDWFAITLTAGQSYQFRLTSTSLDSYLRLYSAGGSLITSDDDSAGNLNSLISYTATSSGTYYLDASDYSSGTGSYTVSAATTSVDDYAASTSTTGSVAVGGSATGRIETTGDNDWFAVTLTAGQSYQFRLTSTGLSDPYLRLYSSGGKAGATTVVASDNNSGGGTNALISYTASSSGTYYLGASDYSSGTGSYSVSASAVTTDDYAANSSTSGRVTVGSSTTGRIETSGDHDWFAVTLTAGQSYQFGLTSTSLDSYLRLYSGSGSLITYSDDSNGSLNSLITYTATSSGTYYLDAADYSSGTGSYTVSAATTTIDDYAANTSTTGRVTVGSSSTGRIETSGDSDWFAVTLTAGQSYQFRLMSTGLTDAYLRLYSSSGTLITSDNDSGGGTNALISYTATSGGTYYLGASDSSTGTGSYSVSAATVTTDDYAASSSTTGRVTVGSSATGRIESSGDHDWFAVTLSAGQSYQFRLTSTSLDSYLRLYSAGGSLITYNDDGGGGLNSLITYTATSGGTYYLDAADYSSGTGSYTISAATTSVDDYAASTSTTGSVAVGGSATGRIETTGDNDWFAVTLAAGQSYQFRLTSTGLSDPYLRLYSSGGKAGATTVVASDNNSGGGTNALISYTASSSGTYYLGASDYASGTGSYSVSAATVTSSSDDYAANTSTTGRVTTTSAATGRIETSGDHDWFAITLTAGQSYEFRLTSTSLDSYLRLYSDSGSLITYNDDSGGSLNSLITYTATSSGTYYLDAADYSSGTGSYTVSAGITSVDDYAANTSTTGRVTVGSSSTGRIESSGDSDWFAVTLTAGQTYQFGLTSTSLDAYLRLYSSGGTLITSDNNSGGGTNSLVSYTASSSGTYYLGASDASSATGSYSLSATSISLDDYAASTSTSGRVTVGSSATGRIESTGDSDWFAVSLTAGQGYQFRLTSTGLTDPFLRLYSSSGTPITSDDDSGGGTNSMIAYTPTSSGTYYLGASDYSSGTGSYSVAASTTGTSSGDSNFSIKIEYSGDSRYQAYFDNAAARWAQVIVGDLPDVNDSQFGVIDDLLIQASVVPIDGRGNILGQATWTNARTTGTHLPYRGYMQFDSADLASMVQDGTLQDVILHEMGHVLGFSQTLWNTDGLVRNGYSFVGTQAVAEYRTVAHNASLQSVPLETGGGPGTRGSHWSESVFGDELMTGYAASHHMPLSIVTIGAMADMGYQVNYTAADSFTL